MKNDERWPLDEIEELIRKVFAANEAEQVYMEIYPQFENRMYGADGSTLVLRHVPSVR